MTERTDDPKPAPLIEPIVVRAGLAFVGALVLLVLVVAVEIHRRELELRAREPEADTGSALAAYTACRPHIAVRVGSPSTARFPMSLDGRAVYDSRAAAWVVRTYVETDSAGRTVRSYWICTLDYARGRYLLRSLVPQPR